MALLSRLFGKSIEDDPHQIAHGDCYPCGAELLRLINETFFYDRPDLQYVFDGSAPPLIPGSGRIPPAADAISGPEKCAVSHPRAAIRTIAADTCPAIVEPSSGGGVFIRSGRKSPAADGSALLPTSTPEFFRSVAFPQHDGGDYERS